MIRLKVKQIDSDWIESEIRKEGKLSDEVKFLLTSNGLEGKEEFFTVLVDGLVIERDLWEFTKVTPESKVDIYPRLQGGTFGQIFKSVIVTVVAVAVTYFSGGTLGPLGAAIAGSLAGMATSLALNALIPPPGANLGTGPDTSSESQMYSITAQSNAVDKYGKVPRVYGTHRIFPKIVANPYTEIEVDNSTGELVQFYYAIYDFGYGPNIINDLKIGETPIEEFADTTYRYVDFNRPDDNEGEWDVGLNKELALYKGDVSIENLGTFINSNEISGGPAEDYRVVRNSSPNPLGLKAEITITFVNPSGLIAYGTDGSTHERTIQVNVQFRKVGESGWISFNDLDAVENFSMTGGVSANTKIRGNAKWESGTIVKVREYLQASNLANDLDLNQRVTEKRYLETWGLPAGATDFYLWDIWGDVTPDKVGGTFTVKGMPLGKIVSITNVTVSGFDLKKIVIDRPTTMQLDIIVRTRWDYINKYGQYYKSTYTDFWGEDLGIFSIYRGGFSITRKSAVAAYSTVKFTPKEAGQYEIRITRTNSYSNASYNVQDQLAVQSISTRLDDNPIKVRTRHTFLELRIRATNQLNGAIQNLSGVVTSVLPVYKNNEWKLQATENPVWAYVDILTGPANKRPVGKDRLDIPSLLEWEQYCDEIPPPHPDFVYVLPRFRTNFILDFDTTVQEAANLVANAAQASLNINEGLYGVLLDKKRDIPVQVFTPRNSSKFSSQRNYYVPPHGLKVTFIDPAANWEQAETVVYADGYDVNNAETFDDLSTFACTNPEQAWRYGRYMMAQSKLRQENISISVDFEHLVCTRGDYVRICQDVMKVGGIPARVIGVNGDEVKLDEGLTIGSGVPLGYLIRTIDGIFQGDAVILSADTVRLTGVIPNYGDLIIIGETDKVWYDCIVKTIVPSDNLTATLTLVEKADAIYDAESSGTLPDYTPGISDIRDSDSAPGLVSDLAAIENSWTCGANSFEYFITIDWEVPPSTAYENFEVYVDYGKGYDIVSVTKETQYTYYLLPNTVDNQHKFKVIAVSASGKKLELVEVEELVVTPAKKITRPFNVSRLSTNITGEVLQLDWEPTRDCIREYLIRYSPDVNGSWEQSIPLLRADKNTTMASTQARTGVYLIKAVDFYDVESETAARAITTIPELFNLNIIDTTTDFPLLEGSKIRVEAVGDTLMLKVRNAGGVTENEYYSEGYYYYKNFLDLGEIYTVRLQSYIMAEGYTIGDIMANWVTLADVEALARSRFSEWDVQTEYRATDAENVMAEWPTLSVVNPISEGFQDNWTPWRKFTVNDATGRMIQFRLKLISNKASVTPRVFDGTIKADMPDRMESYTDLVSDPLDGSITVVYTPSFKGPGISPSIQISIDNAQVGDHYAFDYKNLDGFRIIIYDIDENPVSRTVDVQVKGYGRKALHII